MPNNKTPAVDYEGFEALVQNDADPRVDQTLSDFPRRLTNTRLRGAGYTQAAGRRRTSQGWVDELNLAYLPILGNNPAKN